MYHSISFVNSRDGSSFRNSWDDWHLVGVSRPVFQPPGVKTKSVDLPGADGSIDLTETLTGYPLYSNRSDTMDFYVMNGYKSWSDIYSEITEFLHGKVMKAVLEDDPAYYYEGRFSVNQWKSNKDYSQISIDYNVGPYKWALSDSLGEWDADPFNVSENEEYVLPDGKFSNIAISSSATTLRFVSSSTPDGKLNPYTTIGRAPVCPVFNVQTSGKSGASVNLQAASLGLNITKTISEGRVQDPDFLFYGDLVILKVQAVSGSGTLSIQFRQGRF